jgi:adenosine deaminase
MSMAPHASPPPDADLLRRLPKAELHCHLDGSLRPATLLALAAEQGQSMPADSAEALGRWMRVDDAQRLEDYLARFEVTLSVMQDAASIERVAFELVADAAADGVRYLEVRYCPALSTRRGLSTGDVMAAWLAGQRRAEAATGTVARAIVCALRSLPAPHAQEMAETAVAFRRHGVVAFDLAGAEAGFPATLHADACAHARRHDLALTVHAGEGAGADSIRDAVHACGAHRIGHGTRLFEDPSLRDFVRDRRIALEVCPTSNVQTRVAASIAAHPVGDYLRDDVVVTVNTDNRLMSGVSLTDEYRSVAEAFGLDLRRLGDLSLAAIDHAFLPWPERRRLRAAMAADIDALLSTSAEAAGSGA